MNSSYVLINEPPLNKNIEQNFPYRKVYQRLEYSHEQHPVLGGLAVYIFKKMLVDAYLKKKTWCRNKDGSLNQLAHQTFVHIS